MGITSVIGEGPVCLDTSIFIYYIQEDLRYFSIIEPIFEAIDNGDLIAVTSGITLLETLVTPLRFNDIKLANHYERFLTESKGLILLDLNQEILRKGACLRATFNIKTPDALQIATAQLGNCTTFVTNDRRLPEISGLQILQLSDYADL